jgi:hypothetical protein
MKNKCSNCQYFASQGAKGYCEHPDDLTPTGGRRSQIRGSDSCDRFQWPDAKGIDWMSRDEVRSGFVTMSWHKYQSMLAEMGKRAEALKP